MQQKQLATIFVVVLLDIVGFSMLIPVLPYYAGSLGATPTEVGLLGGLYALCQFVGAPIMARFSDKYGRKVMFLLDVAGSVIGYVILGFASSLWMVFLSRFIAGCVAANIPIGYAAISDITDTPSRSKALGLIGAAFGIGFTIGPALGGILSKQSYALAAFAATGVAVANFIFILIAVKESRSLIERMASRDEHKSIFDIFDLKELRKVLQMPRVALVLLFWLGFSLAFAMFQQNIALFNKYRLSLTAKESGYVFAYIGLLVSLSQGVVLRQLTKRFSDMQLLLIFTPVMALGLVLWVLTPNWQVLLIALLPLCLAGSTLIAVTNSILTKSVAEQDTGGIMGISAAIDNSTRVMTAAAGGWMIQYIGIYAPGIVASAIMLLLIYYAVSRIKPVVG